MFDNLKKKQQATAEEEGMDILTDVKEPFSMSGFFETHVIEKAKQFKNTLAEKGILFFFFSPFQARSRLIAQILILCIGILFGVVPRASSMVSELQDQAYASEISGLSKKTVGSLSITPAASSNYKRLHVLAFVLEGKNLPSDASKYEVHLARGYGSSDWSDVTYSWTTLPVTDTKRILLVSIDQSKQASGYGAFQLYIQLAGEEVSSYAKTPFEITLSTAQETTDLYDKTGLHLSALTEAICGKGNIAEKQAEFEKALKEYQVALEQAEAMPVDIHVAPTRDEIESYCLANRLYRTLDDNSTTEDILNIEPVSKTPELDYGVVITSDGIRYDSAYVTELREGECSDEDIIRFNAFDSMDNAKKSVISAMDSVNTASMAWYSTLASYKLILNQNVDVTSFPLYARCTNTIEDDINFIDKTSAGGTDEDPDSGDDSGVSDGDGETQVPETPGSETPEESGQPDDIDEQPEEVPSTQPSEEQPEEVPSTEPSEVQPEETPGTDNGAEPEPTPEPTGEEQPDSSTGTGEGTSDTAEGSTSSSGSGTEATTGGEASSGSNITASAAPSGDPADSK